MQQIYLLEIFVDNVRVFVTGEEERSSASKNMCVKIGFGPKNEIFIREHQLDPGEEDINLNTEESQKEETNKTTDDDLVTVDERGKRGWTRKIRVGKSFLFPSYSDTVLTTLRDFPLEIEVWNDDDREMYVFAANGIMRWNKDFFEWLQEEDQPNELHESFCVKQIVPLHSDCCCSVLGEITLILRLNAFGDSVTTEFQATDDENLFYIRSNKSPNVLKCERLEPFKNLNFVTIGTIHDAVDIEDPTILGIEEVEVCTEFDPKPCSKGASPKDLICRRQKEDKYAKKIYNNKIKMGEIKGPCGNPNCKLAEKVKAFLRKLKTYKEAAETAGIEVNQTKDPILRKVCGSCVCKKEEWHREGCPEKCVYPVCDEDKDVTFKEKPNVEPTQANYLLMSDQPAGRNICVNASCSHKDCPKKLCVKDTDGMIQSNVTEKHFNTCISIRILDEKEKNYHTYRDIQKHRECTNPQCSCPSCVEKRNQTDGKDASSPFGKDYIVNNVTVKYDIQSKKPCKGCGCRCRLGKRTSDYAGSKYAGSSVPDKYNEATTSQEPKEEISYEPKDMLNLVKEIRDRDKDPTNEYIDQNSKFVKDPPGTHFQFQHRNLPNDMVSLVQENRDKDKNATNEYKSTDENSRYFKERPGPLSQFVYKALSDPPKLAAIEIETLKQLNSDQKDDKECKCEPPKLTPPCRTFDCACLTKNIELASRKFHKPYCPSYIHKENCPVNKTDEDEEHEDDEDEPEPLPYGLPPIQLGPCPVLGRPCCVPDGFARMYKIAAIPPQPPSWSDAGKICCSKEFERIKKAIEEYMKYEKDHDMRCLNKFNVDTERRCCDKEQRLFALIGKGCCGSHKMALQEKYKEYKEKNNK